jgi:hypothetical protein
LGEFLAALQSKVNGGFNFTIEADDFITYATAFNGKSIIRMEEAPYVVTNVDRIPFVWRIFGRKTSDMTGITPLIDLLDLNLGHFRVSSDRRWLMHLSCVPVPVEKGGLGLNLKGKKDDAVEQPVRSEGFAPNVLKRVATDGDFKYVEPTGTAFEPTGKEIGEIEKRMAAIGLAFMAAETRSAETAYAKRLDSAVQNATLTASADTLDDMIEEALSIHAQMMKVAKVDSGGELSGGSWKTSRDYEKVVMTSQMLDSYAKMHTNNQLTFETLWDILEDAGALPESFDAEAEKAALVLGGALSINTLPTDPSQGMPPNDPTADPKAQQQAPPAADTSTDPTGDMGED